MEKEQKGESKREGKLKSCQLGKKKKKTVGGEDGETAQTQGFPALWVAGENHGKTPMQGSVEGAPVGPGGLGANTSPLQFSVVLVYIAESRLA